MGQKVALVFPGSGSQYKGMAKAFFDRQPEVKNLFREADRHLGFDLSAVCLEGSILSLSKISNMLPGVYVTSVAAFYVLMKEFDIKPLYLAGHSLGELSALVCSGALSFEAGLEIVKLRSEIAEDIRNNSQGGMTIIKEVTPAVVKQECDKLKAAGEIVDIACYNSPQQVSISGTEDAILKVEKNVLQRENKAKIIPVVQSAPYHSELLRDKATTFRNLLSTIDWKQGSWPVVSNVTALPYQSTTEIIENLTCQLYMPVLWDKTIDFFINQGLESIIEVGPQNVLKHLVLENSNHCSVYAFDEKNDRKRLKTVLAGTGKQAAMQTIQRCLKLAVSTKNHNQNESDYQQCIAAYQDIEQLKENVEFNRNEDFKRVEDTALEKLQRILSIKGVPLAEQQQKRDRIKETGTQKPIHELFSDQAGKTPENIAVRVEDKHLSYKELHQKVIRLANTLRRKGIGKDVVVGIMMDRSAEMILAILATLKAGGAYLPIDPAHPVERKRQLITESGLNLIISSAATSQDGQLPCDLLVLDREQDKNTEPVSLPSDSSLNDLAYVMYTSGSTGKPKGVMIEHGALLNRIEWMNQTYPLNQDDVILQKTTFTFDVSVWELLWWSIAGASVCIMPPGKEHNPAEIFQQIVRHQVTILHFVPSVFGLFLEYLRVKKNQAELTSLKYVFVSGEALNPSLVNEFHAIFKDLPQARIVNLYGPTEAAIDVTYFNCKRQVDYQEVPIGKPINQIELHILDDKLDPVTTGDQGELYIAGKGLARGYLRQPALTAERFIDNPFRPGTKMYKTGDIVRKRADNQIVYISRNDNQVKIRGLRIEPGEIEYHLLNHDEIKTAAVVVKQDEFRNQHLWSYFTTRDKDSSLSNKKLKEYLVRFLPLYMIPARFTQVDSFPLLPNGKLDTKKLLQT